MMRYLAVILIILKIDFEISCEKQEKSLFDDLPYNGAFIPKNARIELNDQKPQGTENLERKILDKKSLFETLPNQGAISKHDLSLQRTERKPRDSLLNTLLETEAGSYTLDPPESEVRLLISEEDVKNTGWSSEANYPVVSVIPSRSEPTNRPSAAEMRGRYYVPLDVISPKRRGKQTNRATGWGKSSKNFRTRTLLTVSDYPGDAGWGRGKKEPRPADSVSITSSGASPSYTSSSTYLKPPPRSSYGPPSATYGPPTQQQNDFIGPPAPPPDQYRTTVTLQTIPVTRQVTELVQVPQIVHSISSSDQALADDVIEMPEPPSHKYGPPSKKSKGRRRKRPFRRERLRGNEEQRLMRSPFENHLQQILSVTDDSTRLDDDFRDELILELLTQSQGSSPNFQFNDQNNRFLGSPSSSGGSNLLTRLFTRFRNRQNPRLTSERNGASSLLRELRLQRAFSQIRRQLRQQGKQSRRDRQNFRNMLYKGALLISALSLVPKMTGVAAPVATSSGLSVPSFMMPILTGRRKRSISSQVSPAPCLFNVINLKEDDKSQNLTIKKFSPTKIFPVFKVDSTEVNTVAPNNGPCPPPDHPLSTPILCSSKYSTLDANFPAQETIPETVKPPGDRKRQSG